MLLIRRRTCVCRVVLVVRMHGLGIWIVRILVVAWVCGIVFVLLVLLRFSSILLLLLGIRCILLFVIRCAFLSRRVFLLHVVVLRRVRFHFHSDSIGAGSRRTLRIISTISITSSLFITSDLHSVVIGLTRRFDISILGATRSIRDIFGISITLSISTCVVGAVSRILLVISLGIINDFHYSSVVAVNSNVRRVMRVDSGLRVITTSTVGSFHITHFATVLSIYICILSTLAIFAVSKVLLHNVLRGRSVVHLHVLRFVLLRILSSTIYWCVTNKLWFWLCDLMLAIWLLLRMLVGLVHGRTRVVRHPGAARFAHLVVAGRFPVDRATWHTTFYEIKIPL